MTEEATDTDARKKAIKAVLAKMVEAARELVALEQSLKEKESNPCQN